MSIFINLKFLYFFRSLIRKYLISLPEYVLKLSIPTMVLFLFFKKSIAKECQINPATPVIKIFIVYLNSSPFSQ